MNSPFANGLYAQTLSRPIPRARRRSSVLVGLAAALALAGVGGCAHGPRTGLAVEPPVADYAPLPLPNCHPAMDDLDYWIVKAPEPDRVILSPRQIARLNAENVKRGLVLDVFSERLWEGVPPPMDQWEEENGGKAPGRPDKQNNHYVGAYTLYTYLKQETERLKGATRWDARGTSISAETLKAWDDNLNLNAIHENNPIAYGLTRRRSDIRYYPTSAVLTSRRWDTHFDILQASAIQALEPLAVLHASADGQWLFVVAAYCRGWIPAVDVVYPCHPAEMKSYLGAPRKLVILGHAVDAAWQPGTTLTAERLYMGTVCPLVGEESAYYRIALPVGIDHGRLATQPAFVFRQEQVREGFLPYTQRALLGQAFRLLHTPYEWGGKNEYRDCSQFIMDIFGTMGLQLPRNSSYQAEVGRHHYAFASQLTVAERLAKLRTLTSPSLLFFPGHIMLFLGCDADRAYALHDIWSFARVFPGNDERRLIIGQVVVSDLSLGEGSRKGSLLERITGVTQIKP